MTKQEKTINPKQVVTACQISNNYQGPLLILYEENLGKPKRCRNKQKTLHRVLYNHSSHQPLPCTVVEFNPKTLCMSIWTAV